jgi:hypothetical protein
VDDDMANLIVAQLLYLDAADPNRDIVMYVNSPGGSVTAGKQNSSALKKCRNLGVHWFQNSLTPELQLVKKRFCLFHQ